MRERTYTPAVQAAIDATRELAQAGRGITIQVVLPRDLHTLLLEHRGNATVSQFVRLAIQRELARRERGKAAKEGK